MKFNRLFQAIIFSVFIGYAFTGIFAQAVNLTGLPIIRNYPPSENGGTTQNWAIVQDRRGVMYFANTGGLLEYDGSTWRMIEVENEVARTVAIDSAGTIFVGGVDQFGILVPDESGSLKYKSLINFIPVEERDFGDVWTIWPVNEGVYFQTKSHIFFYDNSILYSEENNSGEVKSWESKTIFSPAFFVNDIYYVPEIGIGLCSIKDGNLKLVRGGERFKDLTIYSMLPFDDQLKNNNKFLIGTDNGFFIYDGGGITSFKTEADDYIIKNQIYFRGAILKDDSYAFGTQNGGLVIMDKNGKLLKIINKTNGLNDNTVWFVYPSKTGELWLGLNNGIARINYPTSLTTLDSHFGLDGTLLAVSEVNNIFYVTSANGVYYTDKIRNTDYRSTFKNIQGINSESWYTLDIEEYQLVATTNGVFKISGTNAELIKTSWRFAYSFCRSQIDKNIIYVGLHDGIAILQLLNGEWTDGGKIPGVSEIVFYIVEEKDGTIWLSSFNKGLIKINPNKNGKNTSYGITRYGKNQGIYDQGLIPLKLNDRLVFGTADGFAVYDRNTNSFKHENIFGDHFSTGYRIEDVKADSDGNVWILGGIDKNIEISKVIFTQKNEPKRESYGILNTTLANDFYYVPFRIYPDKNSSSILWITAGDKLYRFDVDEFNRSADDELYSALIRKVKAGSDSIIYYGGFQNGHSGQSEFEISPKFTSVEFSYAVTSYINEASHRYQVLS